MLELVVEQNERPKPRRDQEAKHQRMDCSQCGEPLLDIAYAGTDETQKVRFRVSCPFCGGRSSPVVLPALQYAIGFLQDPPRVQYIDQEYITTERDVMLSVLIKTEKGPAAT